MGEAIAFYTLAAFILGFAMLVVSTKDNDSAPVRLQRGSAIDVSGTCTGWDEAVKMNKCEFAK